MKTAARGRSRSQKDATSDTYVIPSQSVCLFTSEVAVEIFFTDKQPQGIGAMYA